MNSSFLKQADRRLGKLGSRFFRRQRSGRLPSFPKKIAVIRLAAIGESLLALPAIAALKAHWPGSEMTVLTTPRLYPIFAQQPFIDRIEAGIPRRCRFEVAIDFEPYLYASAFLARVTGRYSVGFDTLRRGRLYTKAVPYRDDQHVVDTNFNLVRAVGVQASAPERLVSLRPPSLKLRRAARAIALAPGGRVDFRRWPAERFAQVADYFIEKHGCEIMLVGDNADRPILRRVQNRMKNPARIMTHLSLLEAATLLAGCRITIANDGGLMHISAAAGTPTLGLFGPETPVRLGPYGPGHRALYHQLADNPIINVSRGQVPGMLRAEDDLSRYVRAISVSEVITSATEMLRRS